MAEKIHFVDVMAVAKRVFINMMAQYRMILNVTLVSTLLGLGYGLLQKPSYKAVATFILEEKSGGKTNQNNIENVMEALLAAIYLDSDIHQVRKIVQNLWFRYIENIDFNLIDPKSSLQEWLHHKNHSTPAYEVINKEGPVHAPVFTVQVIVGRHKQTATGKSIKEAEKEAARKLLNILKNNL